MRRRFTSLLLAAALVLCLLPGLHLSADAAVSAENPAIYNGNTVTDWMAEQVLAEIQTEGLSDREAIWEVYKWLMLNCERYGDADTVYLDPTTEELEAFAAGTSAEAEAGLLVYDDSDIGTLLYAAYFAQDLLTYRVGTCVAFASALKVMLNHLGYACDMVSGSFQNLDGSVYDHTWNRVEIDGVWYWLDIRIDHAAYERTGTLSDQYFLIYDTEAWAEEHIWDRSSWVDKNAASTDGTAAASSGAASEDNADSQVMITDDTPLVSSVPSEVTVLVDGAQVDFPDAQPFISSEGRTLLPVAAVAEAMNCQVVWDNDTRTVVISRDALSMTLTIDSPIISVENSLTGEAYSLTNDVAPVILESRTYLPIRVVAETFGYTVDWDADTYTVSLLAGQET